MTRAEVYEKIKKRKEAEQRAEVVQGIIGATLTVASIGVMVSIIYLSLFFNN